MNHWCEKYILFSGELKGTEPQSMICKITGGYDRKMPFFYRLAFYFIVGGNVDEIITKAEADFYSDILPQLQNSNCRVPQSYFVGKNSC